MNTIGWLDPHDYYFNNIIVSHVNGVVRTWNYGSVISFDDRYTHSVTNNTDHNRAVLIYDSVPLY
jgi:aspartyl/asparaginyl beta-hydroxylase (cupin superfamily)